MKRALIHFLIQNVCVCQEEEEDDDEYDDHSLLADARRKAQAENAALAAERLSSAAEQILTDQPAPLTELPADTNTPERLADPSEPASKKRREGLCTQYIISVSDSLSLHKHQITSL